MAALNSNTATFARKHNKVQLPVAFTEHIKSVPGLQIDGFLAAHAVPAPVSIRYNASKVMPETSFEGVPWCNTGRYLPERPNFSHDPIFHAGGYYVQEASSMFLEAVLRSIGIETHPMRILDLCAAPGGKSTLIAGCMHPHSVLVANEVIRQRASILRENIIKWGSPNVIITNQDAVDFGKNGALFDVIVVDAPCSGSGMFRKDPDAIEEWSLNHVAHCAARQQRILEDILPALKNGGHLIYATCSYSKEEDEDIVQFCCANGLSIQKISGVEEKYPGIVATDGGYRFFPDKIKGEGFFISLLQKQSADADGNYRPLKLTATNEKDTEIALKWLRNPETLSFHTHKHIITACTQQVAEILAFAGGWNIILAGVSVGEVKNEQLIPEHALIMSSLLSETIPSIEIDKQTAIQYLKKETIQLEGYTPGWYVVKHKVALGAIKIVPGRVNNYYPTEWRIRK